MGWRMLAGVGALRRRRICVALAALLHGVCGVGVWRLRHIPVAFTAWPCSVYAIFPLRLQRGRPTTMPRLQLSPRLPAEKKRAGTAHISRIILIFAACLQLRPAVCGRRRMSAYGNQNPDIS